MDSRFGVDGGVHNPYAGRVPQNGVKPPVEGGLCWQAYMHFDECRAKGIIASSEIIALGEAKGLNEGNLRTELSYWRRYHGIKATKVRSTASGGGSGVQAEGSLAASGGGGVPTKAALLAVAGYLLGIASNMP